MQWLGIDVGGTFTDVVLYDEDRGALTLGKSPTNPFDPTAGILDALTLLVVDLGTTGRIVHGTTIGTNAILERTGARVWMLTTRGFRDTLEIARTNRTALYDIRARKPASPVPRSQVVEVDERLLADGTVRQELRGGDLREALERIRDASYGAGPAALVVGFLHSYANAVHERLAARMAHEMLPSWFVCTSAEVLPEMREYERFSTAALNAYIGPKVGGYLSRLGQALAGRGYAGRVYITTSSGGIMSSDLAARFPVHTVLSGPAGGVAAAVSLGRLVGCPNLITYDMGGTSTDVCLVEDLEPALTTEQHIAGLPNRTSQIEINSIGAGGGSIAWLDAAGALRVGPRSAGAVPGPACYGRGGTEPTITDANIVLHRVAPEVPLAGVVKLDGALARHALGSLLGRVAGLSGEEALAEGIIRIAVARMVSAIKEISIAKGHDPRDFVLLAYGGAGPMHAAFVAEELDIPRVIIAPAPGNFSAFGALISDLRRDYVRSRLLPTRGGILAEIEHVFAELQRQAWDDLGAAGISPERVSFSRTLGMRYVGQSWELLVKMPEGADTMDALETVFRQTHQRRYGHATDGPAEIVNVRLTAIGAIPKPALPRWAGPGTLVEARPNVRQVVFGGEPVPTSVYRRDRLPGAVPFEGPAIVEEMGATTVIPPGWTAVVGVSGEITLTRRSI
ncbi:MAG: hydantoinase/oxoprolinase family protein [Candidatus Rokuibacteriota bacterium]